MLPRCKPVATASISLNKVKEIQMTWQSCLTLQLQLIDHRSLLISLLDMRISLRDYTLTSPFRVVAQRKFICYRCFIATCRPHLHGSR